MDRLRAVISEIRIRNFKSIHDLTLKPGRVTVLIGENGSGKSNILEGIGFAAAAVGDKLDGEFLFNRGIRVTDWKWMVSAFADSDNPEIEFEICGPSSTGGAHYSVCPVFVEGVFERWGVMIQDSIKDFETALNDTTAEDRNRFAAKALAEIGDETLKKLFGGGSDLLNASMMAMALNMARRSEFDEATGLSDFLIYAPENTVLRNPPPEGAIQPVGTKGEGLFRLLQTFADPKNAEKLADLKEQLRLFGWFDDFLVPDESATAQARIQIRDKWLAPERAIFDQRSANEGFLYLLFYFTVIMSARTPRFFAFDNVDNALNPKLCSTLMKQITELAKKYGKQVICTTHNAAILDGLDLEDDDVRLFTVRRDSEGHTALHRVKAPKPQPGETPVRLSEAFMRGILGGLPDHF